MKQRLAVLAVLAVAVVPLVSGETYFEDFSSDPGISRIQFDDSDKDQLATTPLQGSGHSVGRIEFELTKIKAENSLNGAANPGFWTDHNVNNASSARLDFIPENEGACPGTSETKSRLSTNKYGGTFNGGKDYCTGQTGFYTVEFRLLGNSEVEIKYLDSNDNVLVEDNISHTNLVFNYLGVKTFRGTGGGSYETSYDAGEEAIYFEGARYANNVTGYIHNITYGDELQPETNFTVKAQDAFNQTTISNFSANLTGQTSGTTYDLNTSNGEIVSPVLSNSSELWDVQVDSAGFESKTYQGLNVSQNTTLSARLRQAQSKFTTAFTKVSNDSLTDFNVTVEGQTFPSNSTFASPGEYNATFSKNGWYNKTEFYSQATLNQTFRDVYDHKLTIGVEEIRNGLTVNNFSGHIEAENYDYNESFNTFNTSSDTAQINLESNTTYTAAITNTSDGFATRYQNGSLIMKETFTTPANQSSSQLFKTYTYNSVEFNVEDVDTLNTLTQTTNISLINGPEDRELSNNNGSLFTDDLLTGSYTARITSNGFATQDYFFEVGESTFQELGVFLDDTTTQIFFTVRDSTRDPVSGAVMTMKTTLNGSTVTVGQKRTDFSGTASFLLNPEKTYSFTVQKPGFNTFEGEVQPSLTEYTVTITEGARGPYKSPREDYDFRTNVTVNNGTWTWEWNTISQNNKIRSQNYSFTYNGTTYKGSSTNQAGAFFNETGGVVPIDNVLEVDYEVQTQSGIDQYTRRFSLRDTSTTLSGFLDIRDSSGPVTRAIIAFLVIAPLTVAATLASQSIAAGSLTAGALIGFFGFVGFLPVQTVIVVSTILTLTGVTIGVRQR